MRIYKEDIKWLITIGVILFFALIFIIIAYNWGHGSGFEEQLDSVGVFELGLSSNFIKTINHTEKENGPISYHCSVYSPRFSSVKDERERDVQSDYWELKDCKMINFSAVQGEESDKKYIEGICRRISFNESGTGYYFNRSWYDDYKLDFNNTEFNQTFCTPRVELTPEEYGRLNLNIYWDNGTLWEQFHIK